MPLDAERIHLVPTREADHREAARARTSAKRGPCERWNMEASRRANQDRYLDAFCPGASERIIKCPTILNGG